MALRTTFLSFFFIFSSLTVSFAREIRIVSSFYPVYIIAKNVTYGVPGVLLDNFTPPVTGCLHDYSVTTEDLKKLTKADLFIANGAGMESFIGQIIERFPGLKVIDLSEGIPLIRDNIGGYNPHVWVSISDVIIQVNNLNKALQKFDPEYKAIYEKNAADYIARLEKLRQKMHSVLKPYSGREIITMHEAFPYFAREFGLKIAGVIEREPGSEPSPRELTQTIELIKEKGKMPIFSEPQYSLAVAGVIARETGSKVYPLDPAVIGNDDRDAYINIMEENLNALSRALKEN